MSLKIEVKKIEHEFAHCALHTGDRTVTIWMSKWDYYQLIVDGFYILDRKEPDSTGILNTTETYETIKH